MPYIDAVAKERLSREGEHPTTVGELNYLLTHAAIEYVRRHPEGLRYAQINHVMGSFKIASAPLHWQTPVGDIALALEFKRIASTAALTDVEIYGAFECALAEFYRRVAAPYEDKAILKNGDVYPSDMVHDRVIVTRMSDAEWAEVEQGRMRTP